MIHLLLEARKTNSKSTEVNSIIAKNNKTPLTDEDITAQALIFFFAGFDTVSSAMCFMCYELAVNPEIQEKLLKELDEASENCGGKPTYDIIMNLKYLDMVLSGMPYIFRFLKLHKLQFLETLRKWPISIAADRICNKPYTIEPITANEKPLHLEKNVAIWIPIYSLHRDPQYYPDPDRFDPERFNDENKININPYTYMPFGVGPRNCIGSRFAQLEVKTLFFHILSQFEIVPVEKTTIPIKIDKKQFSLTSEDGFWLGLKRRTK